jgi:predicted anti-sigma-YlaC factor YlaD
VKCAQARRLLPDHLDELVGPRTARALDAHVEHCAACRAVRERIEEGRRRLYAPFAVPPAPAGTEARIRARIARPVPAPGRWRLAFSCAASFAAGVVVTLAVLPRPAPAARAPAVTHPLPPASPAATAYEPVVPPPRMRIR